MYLIDLDEVFKEPISDAVKNWLCSFPVVMEWVPICERTPPESGTYMVSTDSGAVTIAHYYKNSESFNKNVDHCVTHWSVKPKSAMEVK